MAFNSGTGDFYFTIDGGCPGPFKLVSGWVHMLEKHRNRFIVDLTLFPQEAGKKLFGHDRELKMPFEVALMGATTKYGHGAGQPRNVRLIGRFLAGGFTENDFPVEAYEELSSCQWEVVFNPEGRVGFVAKLEKPLPEGFTL